MKQTRLAIRTHSYSGRKLSEYPTLVLALFEVKEACALTNLEAGQLSSKKAKCIAKICKDARESQSISKLKIDPFFGGGGIGINQNLNEFISEKSEGVVSPEEVNHSQSTADVLHTSIRISLGRVSLILSETLEELRDTTLLKVKEFSKIETMSRTCMRDALPTTLDRLFEGYVALLNRMMSDVSGCRENMLAINLGGTVIGSSEGADPSYVKKVISHLNTVTGLKLKRRASLYDAAQNSDDLARYGSMLDNVATGLLKMSRDIRLLASGPYSGFSVLILPKIIKGSSFFPEKVNPTIPETLMQAAWRTQGMVQGARQALNNAELDLNVFEPFAGISLLEAVVSFNFAIKSFNSYCMQKLSANIDNCKEHVRKFRESIHERS